MLVLVGLAVLSIPTSLFGGADPNTGAQAVVFALELAVYAMVAIPVLTRQWLAGRRAGDIAPNLFVQVFGPLYLGTLLVLWLSALPAYFGAVGGVTSDGTPTGALWYAVGCFVFAALAIGAAWPTAARGATSRGVALQKGEEMSPSQ